MVSCTTPNMGLPQYGHGDHPDFLGEINDAYMKIDLEVTALKGKSSINEQAIKSLTDEVNSIKEMLKGVIENGNDV